MTANANKQKLNKKNCIATFFVCTACCVLSAMLIATPKLSLIRDEQPASQRKKIEDAVRLILKNENKVNPEYSPELVFSTINLPQPDNKPVPKQQQEMTNEKASFPYVHPVMAPRKTSGFGKRIHPVRKFSSQHKGLDLAAPVGVNIRAVAEGRVIFADPYAGYGNLVVIDHGKGITTHYGHCHKLKIHPGDSVKAGQIIAEVGSTGVSTGPHLHLEVRVKGQPIDPESFFEGLFVEAAG